MWLIWSTVLTWNLFSYTVARLVFWCQCVCCGPEWRWPVWSTGRISHVQHSERGRTSPCLHKPRSRKYWDLSQSVFPSIQYNFMFVPSGAIKIGLSLTSIIINTLHIKKIQYTTDNLDFPDSSSCLLKTHWRRRSGGRDIGFSLPMWLEKEVRSEDARIRGKTNWVRCNLSFTTIVKITYCAVIVCLAMWVLQIALDLM